MTFDYEKLADDVIILIKDEIGLLADIVDHKYTDMMNIKVNIKVPTNIAVDTSTCLLDLDCCNNDIRTLLFATLLEQLPVTFTRYFAI
jgi:hypothetical protein